ncbi:ATP-dependent Clp protease ATP-binding subunit CLPT2, chloroplastic-like isoform X2 [Carex rostrata]
MAAAVGGCFFQITVQVPSNTNSKSNLTLQPSLIRGPTFLSPRLWTRLPLFSRPHRLFATAALALPTAKPERVASNNKIRWSARAIKSFTLAELHARKFRRTELGTEALLLAVLADGTSEAAKYLCKIGITLTKVREETYKFIEWNWRCCTPQKLSVNDSAQRALDWAVDYKLESGEVGEAGEITVGHLVLGIWSEKESPGHKVLAALGFDSENAKKLAKIANNDAPLSYR